MPAALVGPARTLPGIEVTAIAARDPKRAQAFARRHRIPHVHENYEALLADPDIDAIYNPLPNSLHAEWTIRAMRTGKHVLCEKPFAANAREAQEMARVAAETGRILSEGFAYRYHPLAARMREILSSGQIGVIQHIQAEFCFLLPSPGNIRFRYDLAGGALMDAGCYPLSLIRYLADAEPSVTQAKTRLLTPEVDSAMRADLSFADGRTACMVCDMLSPALFRSLVRVRGSLGELYVFNPYHPHWIHWLTIHTPAGTKREVLPRKNIYTLQLEAFAHATRGGPHLNTDPAEAVRSMLLIDAIYERAGLKPRGL